MKISLSVFVILFFISYQLRAQDSTVLNVHFLYGSKPKKEFKGEESEWFGGLLGGHVGIEGQNGKILNFVPSGKFHIIEHKKDKHSQFVMHSFDNFYSLFGTATSKVKKGIITIPISREQKKKFDSISAAYQKTSPYDYAFFGKRCGSAAYDILSQLKIVPSYSHRRTFMQIFYPRRLRKRLLKRAKENSWRVQYERGTNSRKWERD